VQGSKEDNFSFEVAIWCEALESNIQVLSEEEIAVRAWPLPQSSGGFFPGCFVTLSGMQYSRLFC